jgi:hypothetical protein
VPVRTKLVVHFYASSLFVFVLSFAISHVLDAPLFLYFMGAAVVYRLVILALIARDCIQISSAPPPDRRPGRTQRQSGHELTFGELAGLDSQ